MSESGTSGRTVLDRDGWNTVLASLRNDGFSPVESIKITRSVLHVSLGEAKAIVHESGVWSDVEESADQLRDTLEAAAAEIGAATG